MKSNFTFLEKALKLELIEIELFERELLNKTDTEITYSIHDIDMMTGLEFEQFISVLFEKMGYMVSITKSSDDQGLDVIAEKNNKKIGIQAKCYSNKVSNKAVQEILAAIGYYDCDKGIVITNSYYTSSAYELAEANNIILWDRDIIKQKINELFR